MPQHVSQQHIVVYQIDAECQRGDAGHRQRQRAAANRAFGGPQEQRQCREKLHAVVVVIVEHERRMAEPVVHVGFYLVEYGKSGGCQKVKFPVAVPTVRFHMQTNVAPGKEKEDEP